MKIAANQADRFISKLDPNLKAVLIYGPDHGLVMERAEVVAKQVVEDVNDPFLVSTMSAETIKEDPANLNDELNALSMMGGRRLVRITDVGKGLGATIEESLKNIDPSIVCLLITAGELTPSSKLRKCFEKEKDVAAIACYVDDQQQLLTLVNRALHEAGKSIEPEAARLLAGLSQGDRGIVRREVEKLLLYIGEETSADLYEVRQAIGETTETTLDQLCHLVADGRIAGLSHHLVKATAQGVQGVQIVRAIQRYFSRLLIIQGYVDEHGYSIDEAMKHLRPPVFFKEAPTVKRHASTWISHKSNAITNALSIALEAERDLKHLKGEDPMLVLEHHLDRICWMVAHTKQRAA